MTNKKKFACYCCGFLTLEEDPWGSYEICPVCYWEQTHTQVDYPDSVGPNGITLQEARKNFKRYHLQTAGAIRADKTVREKLVAFVKVAGGHIGRSSTHLN
ncbi:CPCC family cysteine-rich protein [Ktedonobacter racemifer]|uniref:Cysteine-rich CPCC domain-containing protein n=1 Tax=Ktedonobacter racemifer DSM 44963 TaxID=485913 RepID=D6U0G7_KTERA|nr:hypothetical protein Krac_3105 [Ktedonobacter racemifer DSM 44963]